MLKIFYYIVIPLVILYLVLKNKLIPSATINNMTDKLGISADGYTTAVNICKKWENLASSEPNKLKYFPIPSLVLDNTKVYAYKDAVGVPTIGWGSIYNENGGDIKISDIRTKKECDFLFAKEFDKKYNLVFNTYKNKLNKNQIAALASFTYNMGDSWILNKGSKTSGLKKLLDSDFTNESIKAKLLEYVNAKGKFIQGLQNRRLSEYNLFSTPI